MNYESEIRIFINDIEYFIKKLLNLNAKVIKRYSFIDEVYTPNNETWDIKTKCIRIRTYSDSEESKILLSSVKLYKIKGFEFKQSKYPEGKVVLYTGKKDIVIEILKDLGFKHLFTIEKVKGELYEIPATHNTDKFIIAVEKICYYSSKNPEKRESKYLAELEVWGENIDDIIKKFKNRIQLLKISEKDITNNSVPYIVFKNLGFF